MKDIIKQETLGTKLQNHVNLWQVALDAMKEAVFVINKDHIVIQCNKATLNFLGKSNYDEIKGYTCGEIVHGTTEPVDWCPVRRMWDTKKRETVVEYLNGKWVEISGEPIFNDNGEIIGAVHIIDDISSQKQVERALSESEQQYLTILNSLSDAMHVVDQDLRIVFQNPAMNKWLKKLDLDSNIIGKTIFEAFPFLDEDKVKHEYVTVFNTKNHLTTIERTDLTNRFVFTETSKIPILSEGDVKQIITILSDITDQKDAEEKLRISEEKYRNIINNLTDIVIILDLNGKFLYVSPQIYEISGFKEEEVIGKSGFTFIHPEDISKAAEALKEGIEGRKKVYIEYRVKHKDGNYIDVSAIGRIVNYEGEDRVFAVVRDISDYKASEQLLKDSEEKFRAITEQSFMSIMVIQDGILKYFNERLPLRIGYSAEEIENWEPYEFQKVIHPDDRDFVLEQARKKQKGEKNIINDYTYRSIRKDGEIRWVENFSKTINYQGKPADLVTSIDITEKIESEQKLKDSEEKFRAITEQSFMNIMVIQDGLIKYVNDRVSQISGYSREELQSWAPYEFLNNIHPEDREFVMEQAKKKQAGEKDVVPQYRYRLKRKDGEIRWIENYSKTINYEGKPADLATSIDITEKIESEQKLKESEEKYRSLVEDSLEGIWALDENENTIFVNSRICEMLDYTKDEMIGQNLNNFIPDSMKELIKGNRSKREKGVKEIYELQLIKKDGSIIFTEIKAAPTIDENGNYKGSFAYITDITSKKIAEQKLKESEEKYRLISENTDDLIVVYDEDRNIDYLNVETHSRVLGYKSTQFLDKSFRDSIVHEDDRKIADQIEREGLEKGNFQYQFRLKHKNENFLWFEVTGKKFLDNQGNQKILCVSRNINEKKVAEQKIKESEENFRTIAEQAFIGTLILQNDNVEYVNDALLQIFELSREDIKNWKKNDLVKLVHPEDLQYLREYRQRLRNGESEIDQFYSYRVFTKYGKIKWIDQYSKNIIYRGKLGELVTIMDITEKKRAEQELRKLNSLKSELLRRTSHELKTPLVSIKGFSDLLLTVHQEKLDDYVLATIHEIKLGCERLENLIQDILKTAELESESIELKKSEEDLSFLIKLCVRELQGLIRLRNHEINLNIHDKLITKFEPDQIHLVLSNILNNAIKYTPPNGKIEITSSVTDYEILISIKDNGIGLTNEEKKRLFTQFGKIERYGQGLDIISDGSGLGLYITKKIIELHGGRISVRSKGRNKGSIFYFTLPLISKDKD